MMSLSIVILLLNSIIMRTVEYKNLPDKESDEWLHIHRFATKPASRNVGIGGLGVSEVIFPTKSVQWILNHRVKNVHNVTQLLVSSTTVPSTQPLAWLMNRGVANSPKQIPSGVFTKQRPGKTANRTVAKGQRRSDWQVMQQKQNASNSVISGDKLSPHPMFTSKKSLKPTAVPANKTAKPPPAYKFALVKDETNKGNMHNSHSYEDYQLNQALSKFFDENNDYNLDEDKLLEYMNDHSGLSSDMPTISYHSQHDGHFDPTPIPATTRKLEKGLLAVHSPFIQDQHEMVVNSLDTNREVAVNKELHQLSDVLKQVQIHVEDVAEAQRNGIKSQKLSQGRVADVVSAKLNKLEKLLHTNSKQIKNLQQVVDNGKHELSNHEIESWTGLDQDIEGHEHVFDEKIDSVDDMASSLKDKIDYFSKHISTLEANQQSSEQKLLDAVSQLTNELANSKQDQSKTLQLLYDAQKEFNDRLKQSQHEEHKPLMLVVPDKQTINPREIINLHDSKHILDDIGEATGNLQAREEHLVGAAVRQDAQLQHLRNQTDLTLRTLLNGASHMSKQANKEKKFEANKEGGVIVQEVKSKLPPGWSVWSGWSTCYGFGCKSIGRSQRFRVCQSHGGQCGGDYWQSRSCRRSCLFNGAVNYPSYSWLEWGEWSRCETSCSDGSSTRTRQCSSDGCEGHSTETRSCSNSLCNPILPAPVHELSDDVENGGGIEHLNSDHNDMGRSVITCEAKPCLNGGVCIEGGEGQEMSHFIHFHCECVHPYRGIMCDTVCDVETEMNGIVIGVLSGVLGILLLAMLMFAIFKCRRRVKKWKKAADPHCQRPKGCWETLFGSRLSSLPSSSNSVACGPLREYNKFHSMKRPSCASTCGTVSSKDYAYDPLSLTNHHTDLVGRSRVMKSLFEDKVPSKLSTSLSEEEENSGEDESESHDQGKSVKTGSTEAASDDEIEETSSDSNENDNAADHTTTNQSSAKNKTNNQSNLIKTQRGRRNNPLSPIMEANMRKTSASSVKGNRNERASELNDKVKKPLKATGTKQKQLAEQSRLPKTSRVVPLTSLSPNISPANGIGRSLNQFIEACNQMDSSTSPMSQQPKFRDPQLAEKLRQLRNQRWNQQNLAATNTLLYPDTQAATREQLPQAYPLVDDFMTKWRQSGRSIDSCLPSLTLKDKQLQESQLEKTTFEPIKAPQEVQEKKTSEQLLNEVKAWTHIIGNPVHSIWKQVDEVTENSAASPTEVQSFQSSSSQNASKFASLNLAAYDAQNSPVVSDERRPKSGSSNTSAVEGIDLV